MKWSNAVLEVDWTWNDTLSILMLSLFKSNSLHIQIYYSWKAFETSLGRNVRQSFNNSLGNEIIIKKSVLISHKSVIDCSIKAI